MLLHVFLMRLRLACQNVLPTCLSLADDNSIASHDAGSLRKFRSGDRQIKRSRDILRNSRASEKRWMLQGHTVDLHQPISLGKIWLRILYTLKALI